MSDTSLRKPILFNQETTCFPSNESAPRWDVQRLPYFNLDRKHSELQHSWAACPLIRSKNLHVVCNWIGAGRPGVRGAPTRDGSAAWSALP